MTDPDRFRYSPIIERPDYSWPDGKRLAVFLGLNVEHFAFGTGNTAMGHTLTALGPPPDHRNYAWRDYGLRVGIWRIFDLFDDLKLPLNIVLGWLVFGFAPTLGFWPGAALIVAASLYLMKREG